MCLRARLAIFALLLAACGDDDVAPGSDGGTPDGAPSEDGIFAPRIPWLESGSPMLALPALAPCPKGHREVVEADLTTCDAYPETGPASCGSGEAHFPGEPGCALAGAACPSGEFADGLPDDGTVVFVRAGATGGDGSRAAPFGRLADVSFSTLPAETTVALARGRYEGQLPVEAGTRIAGACAAETFLAGVPPPAGSVLSVTNAGPPVEVSDVSFDRVQQLAVSLTGAGRELVLRGVVVHEAVADAAIYVADGAVLRANGLVVRRTRSSDGRAGRGLDVERGARAEIARAVFQRNAELGVYAVGGGTSISLADTSILDTQPRATDQIFGTGLNADDGATVTAVRTTLEGNHGAGVYARRGAAVSLEDVSIRATQPEPGDPTFGRGITIEAAAATLSRTLVEGNHDLGIHVAEVGSSLTLTDVIVRDTQPQATDDNGGEGMSIVRSATVTALRVAVVANRYAAVVLHDGSSLTGSDLLIRGTLPRSSDGLSGRALSVEGSSSVALERGVFEANLEIGVYAEASNVTLTDLVVRDTGPQESDGFYGSGLSAELGSTVAVTRAAFDRNHGFALLSTGAGSRLELTDVVVRDTAPEREGAQGGQGIAAEGGGTLSVVRARVERSRETGILLDTGSVATLEDVVVLDTQGSAANGRLGAGIQAQLDARVTGVRVLVDGARGIGISGILGPTVSLEDVEVRRVLAWDCAASGCAMPAHGYGVASFDGHVTLRRFVLDGAALCGVLVHGDLDLSDGLVRGSEIGACVQQEGYDLSRLMDGVAYQDNGTNLDSTSLPVPGASDPVDGLEGIDP